MAPTGWLQIYAPEPPVDAPADEGLDGDPPIAGEAAPFSYPPPPPSDPPLDVIVPAGAVAAAPPAAVPAFTKQPPPPSRNKGLKVALIVVSVVAALAIGALVWALVATRSDLDDAKKNTSATSQQVDDLNKVIQQQQSDMAGVQ